MASIEGLAELKERLDLGTSAASKLREMIDRGEVSGETRRALDPSIRRACSTTGFLLSAVMIADSPVRGGPDWRDPETGLSAVDLFSAD